MRTDERAVSGVAPGKASETSVHRDVVHEHDSSRRHPRRGLLHLKNRVPGRVQAVVYEQLDVAKLRDQRRQPLPARAFQIRPPIAARIGNRSACLSMQPMIEGERQIDAPQVPAIVLPERFEDNAARHAVRNAGLDHDLGLGMDDRAPHRAAKRAVGVGVPAVRIVTTEPPPSRSQQGANI